MAQSPNPEHFIPLRRSELADLLAGDATLTPDDRDAFRQFCRLIASVFHFEYHQRLEDLKNAYAPFDPDADTHTLQSLGSEERQQRLDRLFADFIWLLERANFRHLHRESLESALAMASDWGLNMQVDFSLFDRLEVFVRGDSTSKRLRRHWRKLWRLDEVDVPLYRRLVLILKMRPSKRQPRSVDTRSVYLKIFKDIPKVDVEMLLPGARLQMPTLQRGKIGLSLASTIGFVGFKIASEVGTLATAMVTRNPFLFWGPLSLVFGYSWRQYSGYVRAKQNYNLMLTESLYYQNLDNNCGVLMRLLDEAEEQECREAMLGYFFLWRYAGEEGWTSAELDEHIEQELERRANLCVDFEVSDALAKLERLQVVERDGDRYRARAPAKALEVLDWAWDNYFRYHGTAGAEPPVPAPLA